MKTESNRLIRIKDVMSITGLSRSYIYGLNNNSLAFPSSIPLIEGGKAIAWLESEINNWVEERIEARNSEAQNHV